MEMILFVFMLSLLLIHEMDAVRTKEWKMFIILKDMPDETAYKIFTLVHLPLYFVAIFIMAQGRETAILYYIMDIFLIMHTFIHYSFRKNHNNGFVSAFSKSIIYILGVSALIHMCFLLLYTG